MKRKVSLRLAAPTQNDGNEPEVSPATKAANDAAVTDRMHTLSSDMIAHMNELLRLPAVTRWDDRVAAVAATPSALIAPLSLRPGAFNTLGRRPLFSSRLSAAPKHATSRPASSNSSFANSSFANLSFADPMAAAPVVPRKGSATKMQIPQLRFTKGPAAAVSPRRSGTESLERAPAQTRG
jgi:hypothetical protein